jgi:hypothetical protein
MRLAWEREDSIPVPADRTGTVSDSLPRPKFTIVGEVEAVIRIRLSIADASSKVAGTT